MNMRLKLFGINKENLKSMIDFLNLRKFLKKIIPPWWKHYIPDRAGLLGGRGQMHAVDWDQSVALGLGQGPLYVWTDKGEEEYLRLMKEISEKLMQLRVPGSDRKVVKDVRIAHDIYHGTKMEHSPSLVIDYEKGIHIAGSVGRKSVFTKPLRWLADNKEEGIYVGFGPDMKSGQKVDQLSILDLAPTLLHLFGVPISDDMDGKVHMEIFKENSEPASREVKMTPKKRP
jgi:predicted AlkP superfamily phosphohydrolase/phosphomutase